MERHLVKSKWKTKTVFANRYDVTSVIVTEPSDERIAIADRVVGGQICREHNAMLAIRERLYYETDLNEIKSIVLQALGEVE